MEEKTNESELLLKAKDGDAESIETLVNSYRPLIRKYSLRDRYYSWADEEDFWQVGLLAFIKSIKHYDAIKGMSFGNYAKMVISSAITDFMRTLSKDANKPLNDASPIGELKDDSVKTDDDPIFNYISRESDSEILKVVENTLKKRQLEILFLYVDGFSYQQIAEKTGNTTKQVDNALTTIKKKLKIALEKYIK